MRVEESTKVSYFILIKGHIKRVGNLDNDFGVIK